MRIIRPIDIFGNQSVITSNNITADTTTEWTTASVSAGDLRKVTTTSNGAASATYRIYEALTAHSNQDPTLDVETGTKPKVGTNWKEVGTVNDLAWSTYPSQDQAERSGNISLTLDLDSRFDTIALFNVDASELAITLNSATFGSGYYDQTFNLLQPRGLGSYFRYCYEPIVSFKNYGVWDLAGYTDTEIEIVLTGTTAKVGAIVVGQALEIGETLHDGNFTFSDYSRATYVEEIDRVVLEPRSFTEETAHPVLMTRGEFQYLKQEVFKMQGVVTGISADITDQGMLQFGFIDDVNIAMTNRQRVMANVLFKGM